MSRKIFVEGYLEIKDGRDDVAIGIPLPQIFVDIQTGLSGLGLQDLHGLKLTEIIEEDTKSL